MLFAQTGLFAQSGTATSIPQPTKIAPEEVNPALIALWWIVPLVIASIWIALTVRANRAKEARRQALRKEESAKSKVQSSSADVNEPDPNLKKNVQKSIQSSTTSKSKKDKSKGNHKNKPADSKPSITASNETSAPADMSADRISASNTVSNSASLTDSVEAVKAATPDPKPSNAIFEPLREATKARRKPTVIENEEERSQRGESASRSNDAYNQLFGGKFERIIPKQTLRSSANRWPASEMQPTKITPKITENAKPQESTETAKPTLPSNASPVEPPAKGLKSFVSKVKNQTGPDSP